MPNLRTDLDLDRVPIVRLESEYLRADVAPEVGGRIVSLIEKAGGHEFLWRNPALRLERLAPGSEYDPNFYGGIDELLPNDLPESLHGIGCPDHGELWTTALQASCSGDRLTLRAELPLFGLSYQREMALLPDRPCLEFRYRVANITTEPRQFLWKLHAALAVQPGDVIECPARFGQVVDPAWSRFGTRAPFAWPTIENQAANVIPAPNGTMDFFYLNDLARGQIGWHRPGTDLRLTYEFDLGTFPYAWLFASYGGFNGHYTVILEPCTAMPLSVQEAAAKHQCSRLQPGESLDTHVQLYAGRTGPSIASNQS